jgi:hypothetical protein
LLIRQHGNGQQGILGQGLGQAIRKRGGKERIGWQGRSFGPGLMFWRLGLRGMVD